MGGAPKTWAPPGGGDPLCAFPQTRSYEAVASRLQRWGHDIVYLDSDLGTWGERRDLTASRYFAQPWLVAMYTTEPVDAELRDDAAKEAAKNQKVRDSIEAAFRLGGPDGLRQLLKPGADQWW